MRALKRVGLLALFFPFAPATLAATQSNISDCHYDVSGVDSFSDIFTCGTVSGSLRTLYYSTHNAYFSKGFNQDTTSYGGSVKYETAPAYGFRAGVSAIFLRGIDHPDEAHTISDIGDNQTNIGEAYLSWQQDDFKITAGDQRINIPFVGDYDWRITPILFRGVDANYGDSTQYLHATKVWRYKPWGDDQFLDTTAYSDIDERTNGMWAIGGGQGTQWDNKKLTGQVWYQEYADYSRVVYGESHVQWQDTLLQPDVALQFIRGTSLGKALAGEVNSTSYGAQLALSFTPALNWKLGYDHIAASPNSWGNGSLVVPYAHNSSSGPYFAQPFFTSTQDLGSGNAYMTNLNYVLNEHLSLGTQYSFMDLKPSAQSASINQSEYLVYFTWAFSGVLKGLSVTDFAGVQTSPLYDSHFWQNRLSLQYDF
ncbi:TonB-dependent receptor [Pantoea dispersa]|uniref:TonB-dependent receptor n=1 Tax=Pantoea dispersa TaxID=59814 RepID=UPI001BA9E541|nr:TonB-dependent receptor [Pantoea dispersa]MBS0907295.1 TonB-dependent receptor [Pantoea dispersa]